MNDPKFNLNTIVNGKNYGTFAIFGRRWSEVVGEWIYEVRQINNAQEQKLVSKGMNLVESCFA